MDRDLEEAYKEIEQYLLENVAWCEPPASKPALPSAPAPAVTASGTATSITTLSKAEYERPRKSPYADIPGFDELSQTAGGLSIKRIILGYDGPEMRYAHRPPGLGYFYCLISHEDDHRKLPSGMYKHPSGGYWSHHRHSPKQKCSFCEYWGVYAAPE